MSARSSLTPPTRIKPRRGIHDKQDEDRSESEDELTYSKEKHKQESKQCPDESYLVLKKYIALIIVVLIVVCQPFLNLPPLLGKEAGKEVSQSSINKDNFFSEVRNLKLAFRNQSDIVWQNVMKMGLSEEKTVHVLLLLYKDDQARLTSEGFARDLGILLNNIHGLGNEVVTYKYRKGFVNVDELLQHYSTVMKSNKLLVVQDLHKMPGECAMIFHTLCDDHMIDSTPYYFIFTMEDKKIRSKSENMMTRASSILRNSWHDLPEHMLHSLISRVVRNVVEISV